MERDKIVITLERALVRRLDDLVRDGLFASRSQAIQQAVSEKLDRLDRTRLARESAKLHPQEEAALADEGCSADVAGWPAY